MAPELPDPQEALQLTNEMRDRVRLYLPALCDGKRRAVLSAALDDTESDASVVMLATLMAIYDWRARREY